MMEFNEQQLLDFINEQQTGIVYLYTPLCGTCQTASKMVSILKELLKQIFFAKVNLNYAANFALSEAIASVPCLLLIKNGEIVEKIYAFHSVPYLFEKLTEQFQLKVR